MKNFIFAALLGLVMVCSSPVARAVPTLSFAGPAGAVQAGTQFELGVRVDDIGDLYAYNLSVRYAPGALRFVSIAEGAFLQGAGTTFFIDGIADEDAGVVGFTGASLIGEVPGASGGGLLFTLTFAALSVADQTLATFSLEDALFLDASFGDIGTAMGADLTVRILNPDGVPVPEPAAPALLLAGLAAFAISRRPRGNRLSWRGA